MRIGILGSGLTGGKLGTLFARAGPIPLRSRQQSVQATHAGSRVTSAATRYAISVRIPINPVSQRP